MNIYSLGRGRNKNQNNNNIAREKKSQNCFLYILLSNCFFPFQLLLLAIIVISFKSVIYLHFVSVQCSMFVVDFWYYFFFH